jgi:hypothetical protein
VIRVSSAQAHPHARGEREHGGRAPVLALLDEPIRLADIDRVLEDSAAVTEANVKAPVRIWRDDLAVALESLTYARSVLTSDLDIVRHCLGAEEATGADVVDLLPRLVGGASSDSPGEEGEVRAAGGQGAGRDAELGSPVPDTDIDIDWTVCTRSDLLMTAHEEMARADLSSREELARVLKDLEAQLSDLVRRQGAVEGRLRQVRAAIVRGYETGTPSARDWLG